MTTIDYSVVDPKKLMESILKMEDYNNKHAIFLEEQRQLWSKRILPLMQATAANDAQRLILLQSEMLNLRNDIVEEIAKYQNKHYKDQPDFKKLRAERMEYYQKGYGLKITSAQLSDLMDRDLGEKKRNLDILSTHIEFLKEHKYHCDQISFGIKNRIALMGYNSL